MPDAAHIKPLTALRFFAAFWVVLYHYWPNLDVGFTPAVAAKGYLGVEAFFVLSGFILCHVYLAGFGEGRFRYGDFLWNRLARVYPLHLATLIGVGGMAIAGTLAGMAVDPNILSWESLPANLLLVHAWGFAPVAGWNHASWSISAEWFAYLTFPGFAFLAWRLRERPIAAVLAALALIAVIYPLFQTLAGFPLTEATIRWGALRIVPCFALGCALHALWRSGRFPSRLASPGMALLALLILVAIQIGAPDLGIVMLLGGLIFMLASRASASSTFVGQKVFVYLGEISYSTYMICIPWKIVAINVATKILNTDSDKLPLLVWVLIVAALVPLSAISYHVIENPCREQMKAWASTWRKRRLAAAGA
ncbi:MAG: acyltransferase family protein [Caulobacter sp.]